MLPEDDKLPGAYEDLRRERERRATVKSALLPLGAVLVVAGVTLPMIVGGRGDGGAAAVSDGPVVVFESLDAEAEAMQVPEFVKHPYNGGVEGAAAAGAEGRAGRTREQRPSGLELANAGPARANAAAKAWESARAEDAAAGGAGGGVGDAFFAGAEGPAAAGRGARGGAFSGFAKLGRAMMRLTGRGGGDADRDWPGDAAGGGSLSALRDAQRASEHAARLDSQDSAKLYAAGAFEGGAAAEGKGIDYGGLSALDSMHGDETVEMLRKQGELNRARAGMADVGKMFFEGAPPRRRDASGGSRLAREALGGLVNPLFSGFGGVGLEPEAAPSGPAAETSDGGDCVFCIMNYDAPGGAGGSWSAADEDSEGFS